MVHKIYNRSSEIVMSVPRKDASSMTADICFALKAPIFQLLSRNGHQVVQTHSYLRNHVFKLKSKRKMDQNGVKH